MADTIIKLKKDNTMKQGSSTRPEVVFYPKNDVNVFKKMIIESKLVYIKLYYANREPEIKEWKARKFKLSSNFYNNLRAGPFKRWKQKSILKAELSVDINLFPTENQNLENFAEKTLKERDAEIEKRKLRDLLVSPDYQSKIKRFIVADLQQHWDCDTIDEVLEQLSISYIIPKTFEPSKQPHASVSPTHKIKTSKLSIDKEINKVKRKLNRWARRQTQINAKILNAFLELKRSGNKYITEKNIQDKLDIPTFIKNFPKMRNIAERNHGKIFVEKNGCIEIWEPVSKFVSEYEVTIFGNNICDNKTT